ncbi:MAG: agmatine deiminase family protein [Acidimicrobiales bacterium]
MTDAAAPPGRRGLRLPGPTVPQERVVVGWPTMKRIDAWRGHLGAARDAVAIVVRTIAELEPVLVVAEVGEGRAAAGWIGDGVEVVELPMDDAWLRDTGPVVLTDADGGRAAVHFGFDAWGGRHDDYTLDAASVARSPITSVWHSERAPFVLEAGAVTATADGTVITTASCLLDPAQRRCRRRHGRGLVRRLAGRSAWCGCPRAWPTTAPADT